MSGAAAHKGRSRWSLWARLASLLVAAAAVTAMAFLQRNHAHESDQSRNAIRDFRQARLDFVGQMLRMSWTAGEDALSETAERSTLQSTLAILEQRISALIMALGDLEQADAARREIARLQQLLDTTTTQGLPAQAALRLGFDQLDAQLVQLYDNSTNDAARMYERQRQQFDLAVAIALAVLALMCWMEWRSHRQLARTEGMLRESESNLRQTIEKLPQLVWGCDDRGNWTFMNDRWSEFTGAPNDQFLGTGWTTLLHPDDREATLAHWSQALEDGRESQSEFRLRRHDGHWRWFEARASRLLDAQGRAARWFGFCTDITERKEHEAALRAHRDQLESEVAQRTRSLTDALQERGIAQARLEQLNEELRDARNFIQLIADNIPIRIAYWDRSLVCRFANRRHLQWFGQLDEPVVGRRLDALRGPEYLERIRPAIEAALRGEKQDFEREEFSAEGEHAVSNVQFLPDLRPGAKGPEVHGFIALATNITRHKQIEQLLQLSNSQLQQARDRADAASRAKSSFLANMSHEIRTPLNAVIGLTHLLRREITDTAHLDRLGKIWDAARHLLQVINDILDLSKIEAGKMVLEPTDFSLDAMLSRTIAMVLEAAREKGLEVVVDTGTLPDRLYGDATRLMQALLNLLNNAVKFTNHGSVLLRGTLLERDAAGLRIRFEVRDTGVGLDPARLPQLFQPFVQTDDSNTRRHGGTGLGLAITRHIAELMGGEAGGESQPGQGSCFWITVQLAPSTQPEVPSVLTLTGLRCLLADDLEPARDALAEMLRAMGLRTTTAASGQEALEAVTAAEAAGEPFAVILLDASMPGMDSLEAARRVREAQALAAPLVMVSANDDAAMHERARAAGFAAVLAKPVTPSVLLDCLMHLLKEAGHAMPLARGQQVNEEALRTRHRGARVLLAEDNPVNQQVAADLLQAAGLVVDIANDGEQAVRLVRRRNYDLVLMDVQMPYVDGLQAARQMREDKRLADLPIIAMTANVFREDLQHCLDAGMNDHLPKPVDPAVLYAALLRWLPERSVPATPAQATPAEAAGSDLAQRLQVVDGLDTRQLLEQCAGMPKLALRILRQFCAHYRGAADTLLAQLRDGVREEPRRMLHSLRGAAGAIGAIGLQQQIPPLERALQAQAEPAELLRLGRTVSETLQALLDALEPLLGE